MKLWTEELRDDLVRVNKCIAKEKKRADRAIDRLKKLDEEQRRIMEDILGEDDGES